MMKDGRLAIFWYNNGMFIGRDDTLHGTSVDSFGRFSQIDQGHFEVWDAYRHQVPGAAEEEYDHFPRGRILFDIHTRQFKVIADIKIIGNPAVRKQLLARYSLPETTIFETDEHYQSE